ncbi:MAG: VOC family protein [Candidatus Dormiibacterota bacterium]
MLGPLDVFHYESDQRQRQIQRGERGLGAALMVAVDNVDAVAELIRADQVEILLEPVDEFYGERVFFFVDPYGYEWKLSQTVERVDRKEVLRRATGQLVDEEFGRTDPVLTEMGSPQPPTGAGN